MANEIAFGGPGTGRTCYVLVRNRISSIWSTSGGTGAFESYSAANFTDYAISATEQGANNFYAATMPAAVPPGVYNLSAHQQTGGSAAQTDPRVAAGEEQWNGVALLPLSDLATSGQVGQGFPQKIYRGQMIQNFPVYLKSAIDHVTPLTSGIVSGQISRDGGVFGPLQSGVFTEIGLGYYVTNLTSGDLLGNSVALLFTANQISGGTSDPLPVGILTQRTSGVQ